MALRLTEDGRLPRVFPDSGLRRETLAKGSDVILGFLSQLVKMVFSLLVKVRAGRFRGATPTGFR